MSIDRLGGWMHGRRVKASRGEFDHGNYLLV
jgi:hypothetical protein